MTSNQIETIKHFRYHHATTAERISEWFKCLVSPAYAQTTWLRIDAEREKTVFIVLQFVIAALLLGAAYFAVLGTVRYHNYNESVRIQHQQMQLMNSQDGVKVEFI